MRRVVGKNLLERARATQERSLLAAAKAGDEAAASQLLLCYSQWTIFDDGVRAAIEAGARAVAASVVSAATSPGVRAVEVQPLMYFSELQRKRGKKQSGAADELIGLRLWFGQHLSSEDMQEALTTQWDNTSGRYDMPTKWPSRSHRKKSVRAVEEQLVTYVKKRKFKGASVEMASKYVRASFPEIDWENGKAVFPYPTDWQ